MKTISLIAVLLIVPFLRAEDQTLKELQPSFILDSIIKDSELKKDESVVHFQFKGVNNRQQRFTLDYSVDGKVFKTSLDENMSVTIPVKYGKHNYQLYCSNVQTNYQEVSIGNLVAEVQNHYYYSVNLEEAGRMIMVEKPVIYCYPTEKTAVSIKLKVNGDLAFTYPKYDNGWNFSADPAGNLEMNGENFRYLFWESNYKVQTVIEKKETGFCVAKEDILSFLEEKLTDIGFTGTEKADFITYWAPRMLENNYALIRFMENEECNEFADLEISPKPDHINRFYMLWSSSASEVKLIPQSLTHLKREGFVILEWGGQELPMHLF